ncbi:MAG: cell division protein FtsZ [Muribaculum sp.]|nr:cell division protein FtsZ [Muribaculaceae bacterium]MCM1080766.1 cell division protein FtsZ [Muribaculum sp.]
MAPEDIPNPQDVGFTTGDPEEVIIKVLGVGGGGNNAVSHMYRQNIKNVSFVVLNTDRKALNLSPVPTKVQIGTGLGAGNIPEVARQAAEDAKDRIAELFNDSTKMVFITAGMGGGTGTGAAPVVARIAREKGLLTIGIVTIPFLFEGERKIFKALKGADEMSKYVDAMLVINNQRLNEIYADLSLMNAFAKADDTLTTAARSISELINSEDPRMNLDFNDVDTTLRDGGAAIISTGYGEGPNRVTKAINDALNSPLLKNRDILTSKRLLFNIFFAPEAENPLRTDETEELTSFISSIDRDVDVIWGMAHDNNLGDTVKITILASGFSVSFDDNHSRETGSGSRVVEFKKTEPEVTEIENEIRLRQEYGDESVTRILGEKAKARYIVLNPNQFDDDRFIDAFEKSPTFNREKKMADEIKAMGSTPNAQPSTPNPQRPSSTTDTTIKF